MQYSCCECYQNFKLDEINQIKCKICKINMCKECSKKTKDRCKKNNNFYYQYVNTCDKCIWFDIG